MKKSLSLDFFYLRKHWWGGGMETREGRRERGQRKGNKGGEIEMKRNLSIVLKARSILLKEILLVTSKTKVSDHPSAHFGVTMA